jgi:MYND finger
MVYLDEWDALKKETYEEIWIRFWRLHKDKTWYNPAENDDDIDEKQMRRQTKQELTMKDLSCNDEMCANCFKEEVADGSSSSNEKFCCGACKRISYCSVACQKEHWVKAHRDQCIGNKKKKKTTSNVIPKEEQQQG